MLLIKIIFACVRRWAHVIYYGFLLDFKHRECSLVTNIDGVFSLKIYCDCGKVFGEWRISKKGKK